MPIKRVLTSEVHSWQDPIISIQNSPPVSTSGNRYLIGTGSGEWAGKDNQIATDGGALGWLYTSPAEGMVIFIQDINKYYKYQNSSWKDIISYAKISDVKDNNTDGGTSIAGSYNTRDINTEDSDTDNIIEILTGDDANRFVLEAGTYICYIKCPAGVGHHKARLHNITDDVTLLLGTTEYTSANVIVSSEIIGKFTIAANKKLEIQHRPGSNITTVGWGRAANFGDNEVYTVAEFWKIA